jgi:ComF family protein
MLVGASALIGGLWERALDLVFPRRCVGCAATGAFLCTNCLATLPRAVPPRCPTCWMPSEGPEAPCRRCRDRAFHLEATRCTFVYEGAARAAVNALKYRGLSALAESMALPMAECLAEWSPPVAAIVPVPLAGQRRRLRGYNQSELLGRELSWLSGLPLASGALVRRRSTTPQARSTDEAARRQNVAAAFALGPAAVNGAVLLVDDVLTSGATLDACARVLLDGGAGPVFALTFARED